MRANPVLSAVLERYKKGEIPLDLAAQEIEGLRMERVGDFACLDLGRAVRCGCRRLCSPKARNRHTLRRSPSGMQRLPAAALSRA